MNAAQKASSNRSTSVFLAAPKWSQDIALARSEFLELAEEYLKANEAKLGKTKALKRFLHQFNNHHVGEEIRAKLRNPKVRIATYYNWSKAFKEQGLSGLLEKYNNGGCRIDPEARGFIEALIWKDHLARYKDIHDDLSGLIPKAKMPSYYVIRNYAKDYREEHWAELVLKHEGVRGLRDRGMQVALGRKDEDLTEPNQRWELDTTVADIFTKRKIKDVCLKTSDGKRCKIIAVIDVFSRMPKFYLVERETGFMVGQVIRDRILSWGLPEEIVIDNGKPYKNRRVLGFLRGAGISVHICLPGNPVEKPHVERVFRTLTEGLFRRLPGYSGNSVANRPNEIEVTYTMKELQEIVDRWTVSVYAETVHRSTGQRPRERMFPSDFVPKTIEERDLDILLMEEHERVVREGHITFTGGKYFHRMLPEGRKVKFRVNDFDASEILVYVDGSYLCTADDYTRRGKTPTEIREARKARNRELRTRIKAHAALLKKHDVKESGVIDAISRKEQKAPVVLPRKADIVSFPESRSVAFTEQGEVKKAEPSKAEGSELPIKNEYQKYLDIRRRQRKGEIINDYDSKWLEGFLDSNLYRLVGSSLDQRLQLEARNEG